jgi:hypothetical protein
VLFTEKYLKHLPVDRRVDGGENRRLPVAVNARDQFPDIRLVRVTKDSNLRIKSDAIGLVAEDYESDKVDIQELYSGTRTIEMPSVEVDRFYGQGWLDAPQGLLPNEFITIVDSSNPAHSAICRNSPETGLDCSGLVRYVFQEVTGVSLPRTAKELSGLGSKVTIADLKPGDLVFFNTRRFAFSHVGIYLGDNRFVHAPRRGKEVTIASLDQAYWQKHFNGARRLVGVLPALLPDVISPAVAGEFMPASPLAGEFAPLPAVAGDAPSALPVEPADPGH